METLKVPKTTKLKSTMLLSIFLLLVSNFSFAQNFSVTPTVVEVELNKNRTPCLSKSQTAEIHAMLSENAELLRQQGKLIPINKNGGHPLFVWPIAQAPGFDYESVWAITNYVDENPAYPDQITDYNCGTRSYDTEEGYNHEGVDIVSWPFWWKQMEDDQMQVIAAEAGQILAKDDGNYDLNCIANNDTPNSIYIQHSDGSEAWYAHLKKGSLTAKDIGDYVEQGEFLGVVGSSGNSTSPHLHFQVFDSSGNLIDPYFGDCNIMNPDSWWQDQKPYLNTHINALLTHSTAPVIGCPDEEEPNLSDVFYDGDIPYFAIYLRDYVAGSTVTFTIRRPDNSIYITWPYSYVNSLRIGLFVFQGDELIDGPYGTWTFEASYNGQTVVHPWEYAILSVEDANLTQTNVYPNPLQNTLFIDSEATIVSANIRDVLGRSVFEIKDSTRSIHEIDVSFLSKGMYFITLVSGENQSKTIKLIKE